MQTSFFGRCLIAVCVRYNAEILRQFSSYGEVYRKEGNSSAHGTEKDCLLCVGDEKCELCYLKSKYKDELKSVTERDEPYRLSDLATHLLGASNIECDSDIDKVGAGDEGKAKNVLPILLKMKRKKSPNENGESSEQGRTRSESEDVKGIYS